MRIHRIPIDIVRKTKSSFRAARSRRVAKRQSFGPFRRIYHYHVRKTGGTSIVKMFLSLSGEPGDVIYDELLSVQPDPLIKDDYVFAGWQKPTIEAGNYFYAFSHLPIHQLSLPKNTFTFTCLRDPVKRIVSHYRMLMDIAQRPIKHPCFAEEGQWLGNSFDDFMERIPLEHLLNQLYMFSNNYSVEEAVHNVRSLDYFMFLERFADGIQNLNQLIGQQLKIQHSRKSATQFQPTGIQLERLRKMLGAEYQMMEQLSGDSHVNFSRRKQAS